MDQELLNNESCRLALSLQQQQHANTFVTFFMFEMALRDFWSDFIFSKCSLKVKCYCVYIDQYTLFNVV